MQCSQPFFVAGPPNCLQFYPCATPSPQIQTFPQTYQTCNVQTYNGPVSNVVGEGDVTYIVLPDGTVQLFFLPATAPRCGRCLQSPLANPGWNNANPNGPWFIRSVNNPNSERCHQPQRLPPPPYGGANDYNPSLTPYPEIQANHGVKFHNDRCTSTEDIGYFSRALQQKHEPRFPSRCSTSVQASQDRQRCCTQAVCDAPCKCPHNCAGKPPIFEGIYGGYDSDMSDGETRRGEKRRKSPYSPCSSCDRNSKRRKYEISSDSDGSDLSLDQMREKLKQRKKAYDNELKEKEKQWKERQKEMKEREKEKKKRDKEFEKYMKESEKIEKDFEKAEKRRREKEMKEKEKIEKEMEKEKQRRENERKKHIHLQDSQMDNRQKDCKPLCGRHMDQLRITPRPDDQDNGCASGPKCIMCKLSAAVSSLTSFATSSNSNPTNSNPTSSNPSSSNPCGLDCPKLYEEECKKLFDKEIKRREAVRIKSEQSLDKMRKAEQKKSEQELHKRESECKRIEAEIQKKIKNAQKQQEKEQKKKEQEQIKKEKEMKKAEEKLLKAQEKNNSKQACYLSNDPLAKQPNCLKDLSSLDRSCATSIMSEDKTCKPNKGPLKIIDISEHPCQGCANYCNNARASGKSSMIHMGEANKYNVDEVLKSVMFKGCQSCNTELNAPGDSRKDCGVLCEGPPKSNKQIATHTEQASSGIFSDFLKRFGIGIQCNQCSPPEQANPTCAEEGSQLSFEFVTCGSDGNLAICGNTNQSCQPL